MFAHAGTLDVSYVHVRIHPDYTMATCHAAIHSLCLLHDCYLTSLPTYVHISKLPMFA